MRNITSSRAHVDKRSRLSFPPLAGLYACALLLGLTSVVLVALNTPLSLVPLAIGTFLVTTVGRNAFARKWAPLYFLLLLPMIVTVIVIIATRR
jgi:hypothetical protein